MRVYINKCINTINFKAYYILFIQCYIIFCFFHRVVSFKLCNLLSTYTSLILHGLPFSARRKYTQNILAHCFRLLVPDQAVFSYVRALLRRTNCRGSSSRARRNFQTRDVPCPFDAVRATHYACSHSSQ